MGSPLLKLPGELMGKISAMLDDRSSHAFRRTNRFIERYTAQDFIDRHFPTLTIKLTIANLEYVLHLLEPDNVHKKVTKVIFVDPLFTWPPHFNNINWPQIENDSYRINDLLHQVLARLPSLEAVEVRGPSLDTRHLPRFSSVTAAQVLNALTTASNVRLTSLHLRNGVYPAELLSTILIHFKDTLTTFEARTTSCQGDWLGVLRDIRDNSTAMSQLYLTILSTAGRSGNFYFDGTGQRVAHALRNPVTNAVEHYFLLSDEVRIQGKQAVKVGLGAVWGI